MPDVKFSQLTAITAAQPADYIPIVDVSNQFMSENGSNSIISVGDLTSSFFDGLGDGSISISKLEANPTFTGNLTLPSTTTIGSVNSTEIGFLSGLRNNVQYQLDNPYFNNGTVILGPGTASSAPLKISPGTNTTTPTSGNIEFDGTKLYITNSTPTRQALATESFVSGAIGAVIDDAPTLLNTLNELSAALNDDANYASTVTTALSGKEPTITAGTTGQYWRGDKSWQTLNATAVSLGNVTNESKATMFTSPTFTGTVSGITATMVGLGAVTNESKATMFTAPVFTNGTGTTPTSTTAAADTNTTQIATTAFVVGQASTVAPLANGVVSQGTSLRYSRQDHVHPTDTTRAPLNSPSFTGTVSGITATMVGLSNVTNESKATMFTSPSFTGTVSGITATMVGLGAVTNESKATMFTSPSFTGTPLSTTANVGTNTTQIATTAFVQSAIVESYNNILDVSTSTLTISSTHYNKYVRLSNGTGTTVNIPVLASAPIGTTITFRRTTGGGAITLSAGSGVTINDDDSANVLAGDVCAIKYLGTDTWDFI